MEVEIRLDSSCSTPRVLILTATVTEEVTDLVKKLSAESPRLLTGNRDGRLEPLDPSDLIRVYAGSGRVFAVTENGEYALKQRLYELEEQLDPQRFVRISHSEIINLKKVCSFDLSLSGTICVRFSDGAASYVSRRYVSKIKKILAI